MWREHRLEIVLVCAIVAIAAGYARASYVPSFADRHVAVSEERYDFDVGTPGPWFSSWSLGDGQAYVLIALNPSGRKLAEEIPEAGYRFARAGYGWVTWALSAGRPEVIPYSLAVGGALALLGTLGLAIYLRPRLGPRSWLIVMNPALFIGFAGDTSEGLGIGLLALALAVDSRIGAALLGVTQPTFLVALWGRWNLLLAGVGAAVMLAYYSLFAFGSDAMIPDGGRLAAPFVAFFEHSSLAGWALSLAAIGTIGFGVRARDLAWVLSGLFVLCFGSDVLRDPVNAWRVAGFLPVLWAFGPGYMARVRSVVITSEPVISG